MTVACVDPEGKVREYHKKILAKENHFFLTGIADGTLNLSRSTTQPFNARRDSKALREGFRPDGKLSYYAAAKLKGQYLFKSALDTDKGTQDRLFTYIDPDKYFPIYGDNSTVVYDVNSQGKFYGLFEWDKSGAVVGNFQTQIGDEDSELLNFNRTLYGGKVHFETPKRTVYGDPVHKSTLFIAEANQSKGHSELLGTGASQYHLRHRNILEGSEQVRVEVRDKRSGMVVQSTPLAHDVDYEMKYDEGRITLRKPVSTVAASDTNSTLNVLEGNPMFIVADYEFKDQNAFPITLEDLDHKTGGVRISQHAGDHLRGGVTYVQEEKDDKNLHLIGGDTTVKLGNFTKLNGELARTRAETSKSFISYNGGFDYTRLEVENASEGTAMKVHLNSTLGEYIGKGKGFLDLSGYWQRIDKDFAATDSMFEAGTRKFGLSLAHEVSPDDQISLLYEQSEMEKSSANRAVENQIQAHRIQHVNTQWRHRRKNIRFTTEYGVQKKRASLSPVIDAGEGISNRHLLSERVEYELSPQTTLLEGQQIGINHLDSSFTTLGFRHKLSEPFFINGEVGAGPLGNSVVAGIEHLIDQNHSSYTTYTRTHTQTDGKTSVMSFGSNSQISDKATVRRERQFVTSDRRGSFRSSLVGINHKITPELAWDATYQRRDETADPVISGSAARDAFSGTATFNQPDKMKAYSKLEYRLNSDDVWQVFSDTQSEFKLTDDFFLYTEYEYSKSQEELTRIDKKQVAIAYRPVDFDWFNGLFKYMRFTDWRPQNLGSAEGGFLETQSTSDVFAAEFALDLPHHFQYVNKFAFQDEDILAINSTNTTKTPEDLQAILLVNRINYHITNRIDAAIEYRWLRKEGSDVEDREHGALIEFTYTIFKYIGVGAGFNFTNFKDQLANEDEMRAGGFFLRLQGKY